VIIGFEIAEVLAIGSPPGIARDLQIFYFTLGTLIVAFSVAFEKKSPRRRQRRLDCLRIRKELSRWSISQADSQARQLAPSQADHGG
jgi:hypothetical protein